MTGGAIVFRSKCRRCEKWRDPREFVGPKDAGYCFHCYENHHKALEVLAGAVPKGCTDCAKSTAKLAEETPGNDIRMAVMHKDGLYSVLCPACADRFELANRQMFRGTPYGAAKGL